MKKIRLLIILVMMVCCLSVLSACEKLPALQTPTNVQVKLDDLTMTWKMVRDARLYTVSIQHPNGETKEFLVSKNTYSLSFLPEGTYTIMVKANGREDEIKDSPWSEPVQFVREREPGLVLSLNKEGTAYEVTDKGIATGDIVIPDTYRGKPVTVIGKKAFFNKSDVTSVTLGKNITTIGDFAFANCSYLTSVTLPESLTSIGASAFASCRTLAGDLVIPNGVEVISEKAFSYCGQLTSVDFGTGVHSVGPNAFTDCVGLNSITLPSNMRYLYDYAFAGCENLAQVDLGNGIEAIGPYAFAGLPQLQSIQIPNSVKTIGEGAFYMCEALADVTLGEGIEMIDTGAFSATKMWENNPDNEVYAGRWFLGLKDSTVDTLNLRNDTVGIANYALYSNSKLSTIMLPDSVKIIGPFAFAGSAVNNVVIGSGVEQIGDYAFASCENLMNVILGSKDFENPDGGLKDSSLKKISTYVFQGCVSLKAIVIPNTVEVIDSYAFLDSGIWEYSVDGVVYAGNWLVGFTDRFTGGQVDVKPGTAGISNFAFNKCTELTGVSMPNSVKVVGRGAFYNCTQLSSVKLPNTLEVIEDYTFYHCDRLQLFTLPPVLRSIGRSAFYKCGSALPKEGDDTSFVDGTDDMLTIPSGVESIGDYAFYGCGVKTQDENLDDVTYGIDILVISDSVKYIGNNAFYGFVSLREVVIGNGVETMGEKAFQKCTTLEKVTFNDGLKVIGTNAFYKCGALTEVVLPDSVTEIGDYAFYNCEGLRKFHMGNGVERIGKFAFYACTNLAELRFSTSLQHISKQAFRNCYSLQAVVLYNDIQSLDPHIFYGCSELTIYTDATATNENWDRFWNSSYRPVVWGCTLSENKDYVVSFTKNEATIDNKNASNTLSLPTRPGFTCVGWNTNAAATEAVYTPENIMEVTDGRRLYAIWVETP